MFDLEGKLHTCPTRRDKRKARAMRASIHGERQQDVSSACLRSGGFPAPAQGSKPANATQEKKHGSRQRNRGRGLRLIGHQLRDRGTARGHAEEQVKAVLGSSEGGFADHAAKRPATPAVTKPMIKACMNSIERTVLPFCPCHRLLSYWSG